MANDDEVVRLLASIDRRLVLLTAAHERDFRQAINTKLLRSPAQIAMFEGIDGKRGSSELAKLAGVGDRSAQVFIKELSDLGFVRPSAASTGSKVIVERDEDALMGWYLIQGG